MAFTVPSREGSTDPVAENRRPAALGTISGLYAASEQEHAAAII